MVSRCTGVFCYNGGRFSLRVRYLLYRVRVSTVFVFVILPIGFHWVRISVGNDMTGFLSVFISMGTSVVPTEDVLMSRIGRWRNRSVRSFGLRTHTQVVKIIFVGLIVLSDVG